MNRPEITEEEKFCRRLPADYGIFLMWSNLKKSLNYLHKAVNDLPDERYCILRRAIGRIRVFDIKGARKDINKLLTMDPNDLMAHYLDNENLFLEQQIEKAYVAHHDYQKQRRYPDYFYRGKEKCMEAILNGLDKKRSGNPLRDHFKIIRRMAWEKNLKLLTDDPCKPKTRRRAGTSDEKLNFRKAPYRKYFNKVHSLISMTEERMGDLSDIDKEERDNFEEDPKRLSISTSPKNIPKLRKFPYRPITHQSKNLHNYMSEKYFAPLNVHKKFLENISENRGFQAPNKESSSQLTELVKERTKYLDKVQNRLRSMRPFYHVKYQENLGRKINTISERLFQKQEEEIKRVIDLTKQKMRLAYDSRDLGALALLVEKLTFRYKDVPDKILRNEYSKLIEIFNILENGYFYIGILPEPDFKGDIKPKIKTVLGITLDTPATSESILKLQDESPHPKNWQAKVESTEAQLKKAELPEEKIYFNFQLANFYLKLKSFIDSRAHVKKCRIIARSHNKIKWLIVLQMLETKIFLKQQNQEYALRIIGRTLAISKTLWFAPGLVGFMKEALEVVRSCNLELSTWFTDTKKRKQKIMKLFENNSDNKRNAEILFRKLSLQGVRGFSIIPGFQYSAEKLGKPAQFELQEKPVRQMRRPAPISLKSERGYKFLNLLMDYID